MCLTFNNAALRLSRQSLWPTAYCSSMLTESEHRYSCRVYLLAGLAFLAGASSIPGTYVASLSGFTAEADKH